VLRRILESLESAGDREAMCGLDARGAPAWTRSGRELLGAIGGFQAALRARGVGAGDRVALDVPRGPDLLPAHVAALALGAAVVPINPALTADERRRVTERADLSGLLGPHDPAGPPGAPELAAREAQAPGLLIFTSGTTGEPKGVPLSEAALEANLADLATVWGITEADRLLHALPAHHVHGLVLALYGSLRAGAHVTLLERFDAELTLAALARERCTLFMGVPTMFHRMVGAETRVDLPDMRLFVSGSAPLAAEDFAGFERRFGQAPLERYGLTETLIVSSNPLVGERRPGAVGFPLPHAEVRLAEDGEIEVRGPAVMRGYWRAPDETRAAMRDGFFCTGDLGRFDEDGYLIVSGRKKELILVGGSNVAPGEVERALAGDPAVEELAAAGVPDADRGERVALFIVLRAGEDPAKAETRLRNTAERALARYKRPAEYHFLSALPRNAMGKLDRRALSAGAAARQD
jgi:malonyl-CoA/methylmalonyl-CoA synthetase